MLFGGLRVTEAATLRWRDVNLSRGTWKVVKSKTNGGECKLQMVPALAAELRAWKAQRQPSSTSAFVFATATGGRPGTGVGTSAPEDSVASRSTATDSGL